MKDNNKNRTTAQWVRHQLHSVLSSDDIAKIALRLAPKAYDRFITLDSVAERIELLVAFALTNEWLDQLVEAIAIRCFVNSQIAAQLAAANPAHCLLEHSASSTAVFAHADPYAVLELTIQTDFDCVNQGDRGNDHAPGTLSYLDPVTGDAASVDCMVAARGKSRRLCGWRPLRFHFEGNPKGTIFAGTGRFIDFVTHCGYRPGQWEGLAGKDEAEHDRRLHQEFAFYQIIRALGGMTLETRLTSTTYKDLSGKILEQRFGFIRERKKRAPRRCGLKRQEKADGDPYRSANATSVFQAEFHHKLIFNDDYDFPRAERNVVRMTDGSEDFYFPYDFDMSGVIEIKNQGRTVQQNADHLLTWLRQQPHSLARTQVAQVLAKEPALRQIVAQSTADTIGKAELAHWLQTLLSRLKELFYRWSANEKVPDQSSQTSPALASDGDLLHLVYIGACSHDIWHSSWDGRCWSPAVKIPNRHSNSRPALANHRGKLHMVHTDTASASLWHCMWDATAWSRSEMVADQSAKAPCALASYGGLLHLLHIDDASNICHSSWDGRCWSSSAKIPGHQSNNHLALASHHGKLHMVHTDGSSNDLWHCSWDGKVWSAHEKILASSSPVPCALASYGCLLHLLYVDDSSNSWHAIWDGSSWSPSEKLPDQQSNSHSALANHRGKLLMAYTGESSNDILTSTWCASADTALQHRSL